MLKKGISKRTSVIDSFVQINQKNEESFAPIENIQIQLKNEFIRDQADKRLRAYINNLKENASINYLNER